VLVDCEGIDAFDQTLDYSTQVFSLGVLLSSLLIFNQVQPACSSPSSQAKQVDPTSHIQGSTSVCVGFSTTALYVHA
jgi:hypothetical protein